MIKIDSALTFGLMPSLRGYSKAELESTGDWDASIARLAEECVAMLKS